MKFVAKSIRFLIWSAFAAICGMVLISASMYLYLSPALPDVQTLRDVKLQTPMRVMTADNKLIWKYGQERRAPLRYEQIPTQFIQALIAIEDKRFEFHYGVDPIRFTRVVLDLLITGNKEGAGGSTLTQQVARNYFLSQNKTFTRKFTEILLALKMESELSKQDIFELYINKHFLGYSSYGIQAAASVYYGKDINDLTLPELAVIAGLHQAPSSANPIANPDRAFKRRNAVLKAMKLNNFITETVYEEAISAPITAINHGNNSDIEAFYLAEMVRVEMLERFPDAYEGGYTVYTTVNSELQQAADRGINKTLLQYSRRHGFRGAEAFVSNTGFDPHTRLISNLNELKKIPVFGDLTPALVIQGDLEGLQVIPKGEQYPITLSLESIKWARERVSVNELGPEITHAYQVAVPGQIVRLEKTAEGFLFAQSPEAQGALVALSPNDGSVQALIGGFDFLLSKYNRAVQSNRQPGSNFKPFIYSAAIDKGFTPASIVNDAPIVRPDNTLEDIWAPKNSGDYYFGPIPLRQALYQSRNVSSVRLLIEIGVKYSKNYVSRFGFNPDRLSNDLTLILGSNEMSPMQIAQGYAVFANGGYAVEPYFISRIEDKNGNILFEAEPAVVCRGCPEAPSLFSTAANVDTTAIDIQPLALVIEDSSENAQDNGTAKVKKYATQVLSPQTAFLMDSMLKDVVQRGTARAAKRDLPRDDLAGKTGTTNDAVDAWFTGYNGDFVASTWVGYDTNMSLGDREFGGKAALPAWIEFMTTALKDRPSNNLPQPVGIVQVRINPVTGLLATPNTENSRFEFFREDNVPTQSSNETELTIDFSANQDITPTPTEENAEPAADNVESIF
jgi:penicillin-binding protein 1A